MALGVLLAGCAMPELEPFAVATGELRRAVVESGAVTAEAMAGGNGDEAAGEFVEVWEDRVRLMDVLLRLMGVSLGFSDQLPVKSRTANWGQKFKSRESKNYLHPR